MTPGQERLSPPDSLEDWQAGDLAECIYPGPWYRRARASEIARGPQKGEIRLVKSVMVGLDYLHGGTTQFLGFSREDPDRFVARAFRKVRLDPDRQFRTEAEFVPIDLTAPARQREEV